jgi:hypothetical protein
MFDEDYIDVETERADVSVDVDEDDERGVRYGQYTSDERGERVDMSHVFDTSDGNGSSSQLDDMIDENAIIENDGRSETRTFFYPSEATDDQLYGRLIRWQDGEGDPQRDVRNRAADRRRTIDAFCGTLDMSTHHNERVTHVMEELNMSHMAHYSSPQVILAIISLVANEDGWFVRDDDTFRALLEDTDTDLDTLKSIRRLVRRKSTRL